MRKRTSKIWNIPREELLDVVNNSDSINKILKHFNIRSVATSYKTLRKRLEEENINFMHIPRGLNCNKGKSLKRTKLPIEQVLVENSTYSRSNLKRRILEENILENKCSICGQLPIWNNIELIMIIDHINGCFDDNRIQNLRMLCPNCNTQQTTFGGGNTKKAKMLKQNPELRGKDLCSCGELKYKYAKTCRKCLTKLQRRFEITKEVLEKELTELPITKIAEKHGVRDSSIRKRAKVLGIIL